MKKFTSKKQKLGLLGEKAAETYLVKQGFEVIDRNYATRFGEIDIIATKQNRLYFFEIKAITIQYNNGQATLGTRETKSVPATKHETFIRENKKLSNPFQNISYFKIKRLCKTAEIYIQMKNLSKNLRWQIDGIGVFLDPVTCETVIERIENISII